MKKDIEQLIVKDFKQRHLAVSHNAFDRLMDKKQLFASKRRLTLYKYLAVAATVLLFIFSLSLIKKPVTSVKDTVTEVNKTPVLIKEKRAADSGFKESLNASGSWVDTASRHKVKHLPVFRISPLSKSDVTMGTSNKVDVFRNPHLKFIDKPLHISDAELNTLLTSATAQLKNKSSDSLKVNALQMLYDIEIEINKPLPEKIILTLKSGSKTLKDIINPKDN